LDEVDDTSILKTGRPFRYRRSLSWLPRPQNSVRPRGQRIIAERFSLNPAVGWGCPPCEVGWDYRELWFRHDPSAQILSVSYAQDLTDKLARDCRSIMMSPWYRKIFPTRLAPHRHGCITRSSECRSL
jgi:hypothetical protein